MGIAIHKGDYCYSVSFWSGRRSGLLSGIGPHILSVRYQRPQKGCGALSPRAIEEGLLVRREFFASYLASSNLPGPTNWTMTGENSPSHQLRTSGYTTVFGEADSLERTIGFQNGGSRSGIPCAPLGAAQEPGTSSALVILAELTSLGWMPSKKSWGSPPNLSSVLRSWKGTPYWAHMRLTAVKTSCWR